MKKRDKIPIALFMFAAMIFLLNGCDVEKIGNAVLRAQCTNVERFNALVLPGQVKEFGHLEKDFCLTDIVLALDGASEIKKNYCTIWLVTEIASEYLFNCYVDKDGHQIHLNTGIICPKGSYLTANTWGGGRLTGHVKVLLTGYYY